MVDIKDVSYPHVDILALFGRQLANVRSSGKPALADNVNLRPLSGCRDGVRIGVLPLANEASILPAFELLCKVRILRFYVRAARTNEPAGYINCAEAAAKPC